MSRVRVAVLVGALGLLAACSTPSNTPSDYDAQTEQNFLLACQRSAPSSDDYDPDDTSPDSTTLPADLCQCRYDYFVDNVPYDDEQRDNDPRFADYDGPTFRGLDDDAGADEALPENLLNDLDERCGTAGDGDGSTTTTEG